MLRVLVRVDRVVRCTAFKTAAAQHKRFETKTAAIETSTPSAHNTKWGDTKRATMKIKATAVKKQVKLKAESGSGWCAIAD